MKGLNRELESVASSVYSGPRETQRAAVSLQEHYVTSPSNSQHLQRPDKRLTAPSVPTPVTPVRVTQEGGQQCSTLLLGKPSRGNNASV